MPNNNNNETACETATIGKLTPYIDKFNDKAEVLHNVGSYAVHVTTINDPVLEEIMYVYGVYNIKTGVREAETRRLVNAIAICELLGEGDGTHIDPAQQDLGFTAH